MYKVMIVDDEYYVRMDIRTMIDWERGGFRLTEDAVDGNDALAKIREWRPDIVLLDIGMPGMDGIAVLQRLRDESFPGKIMILSCHDDFDHVKDALLLGAQDYLLKHKLEPDMLERALTSLVAKLADEKEEHERLHKWKALADGSLRMRRDLYTRRLLAGGQGTASLSAADKEELGLAFAIDHGVAMAVRLYGDEPAENPEKKARLAHEVNERLLLPAGKGYGFVAEDGDLNVFLGFADVPSYLLLHNELHALSTAAMAVIRGEFGWNASIGVSELASGSANYPRCLAQAQQAAAGAFFLGRGRIIHYAEVRNYVHQPAKAFKEYEPGLLLALKDGEAAAAICGLFAELAAGAVSRDEARNFGFELISLAKKVQRDRQIEEQRLFPLGRSPYEEVNRAETAEEMTAYFAELFTRLSDALRSRAAGMYRKEIAAAIAYMQERYTGNLPLEAVASHVHMNSAYFSNLFKRETGENFVVYLQKLRMEQAKRLLRSTPDKVYDIAAQVGVDNYHYFCKTFKQHTGMTPLQYRGQSD